MAQKVLEHLIKCNSVAVFTHVNPDFDCIGSAFALRNVLRAKNIRCEVFTDEPLSDYLGFMGKDVISFSENAEAPDFECYCAVDVGSAERIGGWGRFFENKENTVCIDHHIKGDDFAAINFIEPKRCATGELIFELISLLGEKLTKETASFLYCAISADSGSFQYASVNRRTYEIVIELLKAGIDTEYLCSMLYERKTLKQLKLQAAAIDSLSLYSEGKIAIAKLSREVMEKYNAVKADTDGLAKIPRELDGVMISAFMTETEEKTIRVSLRALGEYNIEPVARHFGGGGHKKASGCTFSGVSLEEAEKLLVSELLKL